MNVDNPKNEFQRWLMDIAGALERFQLSLPPELQGSLDYTPQSLDVLEGFALAKYPSVQAATQPAEAASVDGMARYVGQVFIQRLGGEWLVDHYSPKNAYYGLPQLIGLAGQRAQVCPLTLVTAALDRRTGRFIRGLLDNNRRNAARL